jgi:hypothetical protein
MEEVISDFASLFNAGAFPELNVQILEKTENFLLYCPDSVMTDHMPTLVNFFRLNLSNLLGNEGAISVSKAHFQRKLIRCLRLFRPAFLNAEMSSEIEAVAFRYLHGTTGILQRHIYVFLVDHFLTAPHASGSRLGELIQFTLDFLISVSQEPKSVRSYKAFHPLLTTILISLPPVIELAGQFVEPRSQDFLEVLLRLCNALFENCLPSDRDFIDSYEWIISKSLRVA